MLSKEDSCQRQIPLLKLEPQALLEECVGRMVHSGGGGGLSTPPCRGAEVSVTLVAVNSSEMKPEL